MELNIVGGGQQSPQGIKKLSDGNFEYEELKQDNGKLVITIVGDKGSGKTTTAFSPDGEVHCISLDNKSNSIKTGMFSNDSRIHIIDGLKYYIEEKEKIVDSGAKSYEYMLFILKEISRQGGTDWIVVDGLKQFSYFTELAMRKKNGIKAFDGFSNRSLWKERNLFIRRFHRMASDIARKGVIYTTYFRLQEITDQNGEIRTEKIPNYTDIVMEETDIVLIANSVRVGTKKIFLVECESSKRPDIVQSGKIYDVTETKFNLNGNMKEMQKNDKV